MGALIEFLFSNIYLVIIVLALLSSIFGRLGKGGGRMPDFGGGTDSGRPLRRDAPGVPPSRRMAPGGPYRSGDAPGGPRRSGDTPGGPEPARPAEMPRHPDAGGGTFPREWMPGRPLDAPGREVAASAAVPSEPPAASRPAPAAPSDSAADPSTARSAAVSRVAPALQVERASVRPADDPGDLRKAIIWTEILGPPRALKPYGRRRIGR